MVWNVFFFWALIYMASKVTNGHLGQTLSFDRPLFLSPVFGDYFNQIKWPRARWLVKQNFLTFLCRIMLTAFTDVSREVAWPGAAWHIEGLTSRIITTASCVNNTHKQKNTCKQHMSHWFSSRGRLGRWGVWGCPPFTKSFQKICLKSEIWNMAFRVIPAKIFWEQWNI